MEPQGKSSWSTSAGYTEAEFWGLALETLCLPAAAVAFMTFALHYYKSPAWSYWVGQYFVRSQKGFFYGCLEDAAFCVPAGNVCGCFNF